MLGKRLKKNFCLFLLFFIIIAAGSGDYVDQSTVIIYMLIAGGQNIHQTVVTVTSSVPCSTFKARWVGGFGEQTIALGTTYDSNTGDSTSGKYVSLYTGAGTYEYIFDIVAKPNSGFRGSVGSAESWILTLSGLTTPNTVTVSVGTRLYNADFGPAGTWGPPYSAPVTPLTPNDSFINSPPTGVAITSPAGASPVYITYTATPVSVDFAGTATDPEGQAMTYVWDYGNGGSTTDSTALDPPTVSLAPGTYNVSFKATDNLIQTVTATKQIIINNPPVAAITSPASGTYYSYDSSLTDPTVAVNFSATGADDEGDARTYHWDFIHATDSSKDQSSSVLNPTNIPLSPGTYTVTFTVTETATGRTDADTITVYVNNTPQASIDAPADAAYIEHDGSLTDPQVLVSFSGSGDDDESDAVTYGWTFVHDTDPTKNKTAAVQNPSNVQLAAGNYTVTLTVTETASSRTDTDTITVHINNKPAASIDSPADNSFHAHNGAAVNPSGPVSFTGSSTDYESDARSYGWTFVHDSDPTKNKTSAVQNPSNVQLAPGTYTVTLTVTETVSARTDTDVITIKVNNAPHISMELQEQGTDTPITTVSYAPLAFELDASATYDDEGETLTYAWYLGNVAVPGGSPDGSGAVFPHDYQYPGAYIITLFVTDTSVQTSRQTYTVTVTRPPIDFVFVLDASGSMLTDGKYDRLVNAAQMYYKLFKRFGATQSSDRWGAVFFQWNYFSDSDETIADPAIKYFDPAEDNIKPYLLNHKPSTSMYPLTPIGEGLLEALAQLGALDTQRRKVFLLLSDGKENRGTDVTTVAIPTNADPNVLSNNVTVYTIGIGDGSNIEADKIRDVAVNSGGQFRAIDDTANPDYIANLDEFFAEILGETLMKAQSTAVTDNGFTATANVAAGTTKAAFVWSWAASQSPAAFTLSIPGGGTITPASVGSPPAGMTVYYSAPAAGDLYAFYIVEDPTGTLLTGQWTMNHTSGTAHKIVLEDLQVRAEFEYDRRNHYIGDPITLTAKLTDSGKPILGATVYADAVTPVQGIGNYMVSGIKRYSMLKLLPNADLMAKWSSSTVKDFQKYLDARKVKPDLPVKADKIGLFDRLLTYASYFDHTAASLVIKSIMLLDHITVLPVTNFHIKLFDDGTHGDKTAGDGIYTNIFTKTNAEGNYSFNFSASGLARRGAPFARIKTLTEYVKLQVDAGRTPIRQFKLRLILDPRPALKSSADFPDKAVDKNRLRAEISVTPRDKFGNYLGPFRGKIIKFEVSGAATLVPLVDNLDGSYSVVIEYDRTKQKPVINTRIGTVQLKPYTIRPFRATYEAAVKAGILLFADDLNLEPTATYELSFRYHFYEFLYVAADAGYLAAQAQGQDWGSLIKAQVNLGLYLWDPKLPVSLYIFSGVGMFYFQDTGFTGSRFSFDFGAGLSWYFADNMGIILECQDFLFERFSGSGVVNSIQFTLGFLYGF